MTTQTSTLVSIKDLAAQSKALREQQVQVREALKAERISAKDADAQAAKDLLESIKNLGNTKVIVGEGDEAVEMTLEQALVSGVQTTIKVKDKTTGEQKDRAHTLFMDAGRVTSLTKLVTRFAKICMNEEIRPKANPKSEEVEA